MKALATLSVVVALGVQGCAGGGCSDVGGFDGVSVAIPRALFVPSGSVALDVCDADGCASAAETLGAVPQGRVGREENFTFEDLGRDFEPGRVSVTVEVSDSDGTVIAAAGRDVDLAPSFPNGRSCDGDGYVVGSLTLKRSDRVRHAR